MNWSDDITPTTGLTLFQWLVREVARSQQWADAYWELMDELQPETEFLTLHMRYNEVCDWMDYLENHSQEAFDKQ